MFLELQRVLLRQLVGSVLPAADDATTETQLKEMKLACSNMKCLVVIGEQNHSQRMCTYVMCCLVWWAEDDVWHKDQVYV